MFAIKLTRENEMLLKNHKEKKIYLQYCAVSIKSSYRCAQVVHPCVVQGSAVQNTLMAFA